MNITIKQLTEDDWFEYSQVRLKALRTDPNVFGSNYEKESRMIEAEWRSRLQSGDSAIFLIYAGDAPIGTTGVLIDRNDASGKTAILFGSWLAPDFRGRGLSKLMYQTRIAWAKRQPTVEKIVVSHRASNLASKYANQKHGFAFTHRSENVWTDGGVEDQVFYELKIKP